MNTMASVNSSFLKYEEDEVQFSRDDITVISGQNLAAGAVLGKITASGKYTAYNTAGADGSQNAAGVLYAAVNASAADTAGVAIVRHAVLAKEGLVWGASVTTQAHKDAAYAALKALTVVSRTAV
jgi:hypothetical protein